MTFEKTDAGIWFHIGQGGFSPFVLSWKDAQGTDPGTPEPEEPDTEKPTPEEPDTETPDKETPDAEAPDAERPDTDKADAGNSGTGSADAEQEETDTRAVQTGQEDAVFGWGAAALFGAAVIGGIAGYRRRHR